MYFAGTYVGSIFYSVIVSKSTEENLLSVSYGDFIQWSRLKSCCDLYEVKSDSLTVLCMRVWKMVCFIQVSGWEKEHYRLFLTWQMALTSASVNEITANIILFFLLPKWNAYNKRATWLRAFVLRIGRNTFFYFFTLRSTDCSIIVLLHRVVQRYFRHFTHSWHEIKHH